MDAGRPRSAPPRRAGTPPARWYPRLDIRRRAGIDEKRQVIAVLFPSRPRVSSMPKWAATASGGFGALVEPPIAVLTAMAFSKAWRVMIFEGVRSSFTMSTMRRPVHVGHLARSRVGRRNRRIAEAATCERLGERVHGRRRAMVLQSRWTEPTSPPVRRSPHSRVRRSPASRAPSRRWCRSRALALVPSR